MCLTTSGVGASLREQAKLYVPPPNVNRNVGAANIHGHVFLGFLAAKQVPRPGCPDVQTSRQETVTDQGSAKGWALS